MAVVARQRREPHAHAASGIRERVADADLLWRYDRLESALLLVLVAVAARARLAFPEIKGDRAAFEAYLRTRHDWTISVEYRGQQWETDRLFYTWMRCELVHTGGLPMDVVVDTTLFHDDELALRAGGAPEDVLRLSPGWYDFLCRAALDGLPSGT